MQLLAATCLLIAALGLALAIFGASWGSLDPFVGTTLGILGGSIAGQWVAAYWVVAILRRGRPAVPPRPAFRSLFWICVAFVGIAIVTAVAPQSFVFELYNGAMAAHFGPVVSGAWHRFVFGAIGVAVGVHFLLLAWAVRVGGAQRWVLQAVSTSVLAWFLIDSSVCAIHGAWFNILMINVPTLAFLALPFWLAVRTLRRSKPRPRPEARVEPNAS